MMKFLVALTLLVASAAAAPVDRDALEKDFNDFFALWPAEKIDELNSAYNARDAEYQNLGKFLLSEDYKVLLQATQQAPQSLDLINFIDDAGMKIYDYINKKNDGLGIDHLVPPEKLAVDDIVITGGLQGFAKDLNDLLPNKEMDELHEHKLKTSPNYAYFMERVSSKEFKDLTVEASFSPEFINMLHTMQKANIDVSAVKKVFCLTIGIKLC